MDTLRRQAVAVDIKINNMTEAIAQGMNQKVMFDKMEALHLEKQLLQKDLGNITNIEDTVEVSEEDIRSLLEKTKELV